MELAEALVAIGKAIAYCACAVLAVMCVASVFWGDRE